MASGFRVAQLGPWSVSRDWNLRATRDGETYLPFRYHVRPEHDETCSTTDDDEFQNFLQLPVELQQHIVSFCSPSTLFQLMHTSSSFRQEAKKLFWSDTTSRYVIDGQWLLVGGRPCNTNYNLETLTHIRYIEVDFSKPMADFAKIWRGDECFTDTPQNQKLRAVFWTALRHRFPRVIDIVLNERSSKRRGTPLPEDMIFLATGCPEGITVSVSQLRYIDNWYLPETRHLWRRDGRNCTTPTWDLVETSWNPRRITPPTRQFSGPVGEYQRYIYDVRDINALGFARNIHAMHATAAYHQHIARSPCICPWPACKLEFKKPEDWMAHYLEGCLRGHDHEGKVPLPPDKSIRAALARFDSMLGQKRSELTVKRKELQVAYYDQLAAEQFLQQLRDDPLYASDVKPEKNDICWSFRQDMNPVGDNPIIY